MKQTLLVLLFLTQLLEAESFITQEEYARQLYYNPRGISCDQCHGEKGEGRLVARYEHKGVQKAFSGPAINTLKYADFEAALDKRLRGMPRYFLTRNEIKALYFYLQQQKKKQE